MFSPTLEDKKNEAPLDKCLNTSTENVQGGISHIDMGAGVAPTQEIYGEPLKTNQKEGATCLKINDLISIHLYKTPPFYTPDIHRV